jgi:hypothetical protein
MTPVQLTELKDKLENASNYEIKQLYTLIFKRTPDKDPQDRLLLPSALKRRCIEAIEALIKKGDIKVVKT